MQRQTALRDQIHRAVDRNADRTAVLRVGAVEVEQEILAVSWLPSSVWSRGPGKVEVMCASSPCSISGSEARFFFKPPVTCPADEVLLCWLSPGPFCASSVHLVGGPSSLTKAELMALPMT